MDENDSAGIDLYADDADTAFADDYNKETADIYDDVVSIPTVARDSPSPVSTKIPKHGENTPENRNEHPKAPEAVGRRHQLYIGNLTWWTKDQDIFDAILEVGITDCIEVKFFENRINGQSKGYCVVSLKSELSARACLEKLPLKELHGRKPVVTNPTKQALNVFESQSKTRPTPQPNLGRHSYHMGPSIYGPMQRYPPPMLAQGMLPQTIPVGSNGHLMPPPSVMFPPRLSTNIHAIYNNGSRTDFRGLRTEWSRPRFSHYSYSTGQSTVAYEPTRVPASTISKQYSLKSEIRTSGIHQPSIPGAPNSNSPTNSQVSPNDASPDSYRQTLLPMDWAESSQMYGGNEDVLYNDAILEKILSNNRKISSTAITRAVSDTASGDYSSAIDTLSTALSLIRQSHAAEDDRCKILMSSLQDTLDSVESKAYESRHSRSRDVHYESHESSERRSRNRHTRERSYFEGNRRSEYYRDEYEERSRKRNGSDDFENRSSRASSVYNPSKRGSYQDYSRKDDRDSDRKYYERERERSVRRTHQ